MHVLVYDAIKWPASTWLSSLVCRARHRYHRGYASWVKLPHSLKFFSLLLKLCLLLQISSSSSSKNLCRYLMYPVISQAGRRYWVAMQHGTVSRGSIHGSHLLTKPCVKVSFFAEFKISKINTEFWLSTNKRETVGTTALLGSFH